MHVNNHLILKRRAICFALTFLFFLIGDVSIAGSKGKLKGKITDAKTGEVVLNASIELFQDSIKVKGCCSDLEGNYTINSIFPGIYSVSISRSGYVDTTISELKISPHSIVQLSMRLEQSSVKLGAFIDYFHLGTKKSSHGELSGHITDLKTETGILHANLVIPELDIGAASDSSGFYKIRNVPEGVYTVKITCVGYHFCTVREVAIEADSVEVLNIQLTRDLGIHDVIPLKK